MSAIAIKNLCKVFKGRTGKLVALDNVTTSVPAGALCALLGKNGAGKSTLIKCAAGIYIPDAGTIEVDGTNILRNKKAQVSNISVLLDGGRNLFRYMTVEENIRYFTLIKGTSRNISNMKELKAKAIEALDVGNYLNKTIDRLSYGIAQRVAITVAIACASPIIILDEPTKGLDFVMTRELSSLLKEIKDMWGSTVILSSHDLAFVESLSDYIILINNGALIKEGTLDEFKSMLDFNSHTITVDCELTTSQVESLKMLNSFTGIGARNSQFHIHLRYDEDIVAELLRIKDLLGLRITSVTSDDRLSSIVECVN